MTDKELGQNIPTTSEKERKFPLRVLVIMQDESLGKLIQISLALADYSVERAGAFEEVFMTYAIRRDSDESPDIVITDFNPGQGNGSAEGFSIAQFVKNAAPQTKLVVLANSTSPEGLSLANPELKEMGVDFVLDRPFALKNFRKIEDIKD